MFKKKENAWENIYLKKYNVHYSRIIASWVNAGGDVNSIEFREWLRSIKDENNERILTEDQVWQITKLATCGKLEFENDAERFIKEHK